MMVIDEVCAKPVPATSKPKLQKPSQVDVPMTNKNDLKADVIMKEPAHDHPQQQLRDGEAAVKKTKAGKNGDRNKN